MPPAEAWVPFLVSTPTSPPQRCDRSVFLSSDSKESDSSLWDPGHVQTLGALHPDSGCETHPLPPLSRVCAALLRCPTGSSCLQKPVQCSVLLSCKAQRTKRAGCECRVSIRLTFIERSAHPQKGRLIMENFPHLLTTIGRYRRNVTCLFHLYVFNLLEFLFCFYLISLIHFSEFK